MSGPMFVQVLGLHEHRRAAPGGQPGTVSVGRVVWDRGGMQGRGRACHRDSPIVRLQTGSTAACKLPC